MSYIFNTKITNELTLGKILYILLILFNVAVLSWFVFNQPEHMAKSLKYLVFTLISLIVFTLDFIISKDKNQLGIINFVTIERDSFIGRLPARLNIFIYGFILLFSVAVFMFVSSTRQSIVGTPEFQVVELGMAGSALLTFAIINSENLFFFGFLAPTIFGLFNFITRNKAIVALIISAILTPTIFMLYHVLAYGFNEQLAMMMVFGFGLINTVWILFVRNILFCDAVHFTNNFAIDLLKTGV